MGGFFFANGHHLFVVWVYVYFKFVRHTQQKKAVHAVKENPWQHRAAYIAHWAAYEDVGDIADVLVDIDGQVLKRGA